MAQGVRDAESEELGEDGVLTLITVDVSEGCSCCLYIAEGIVQLALLFLKDGGYLEGGIGCRQG